MNNFWIRLLVAAVCLALAAVTVFEYEALRVARDENARLLRGLSQIEPLQEENRKMRFILEQEQSARLSDAQLRELAQLREEVAALRANTNELAEIRRQVEQIRSLLKRLAGSMPEYVEGAEGFYPRETWEFGGYDDPESAFLSVVWARSNGDLDAMLQGMSSKERGVEEARILQSRRPLDEERVRIAQDLEFVTGYRVLSRETISADSVVLVIHVEGIDQERPARARMIRTADGWLFDGMEGSE